MIARYGLTNGLTGKALRDYVLKKYKVDVKEPTLYGWLQHAKNDRNWAGAAPRRASAYTTERDRLEAKYLKIVDNIRK